MGRMQTRQQNWIHYTARIKYKQFDISTGIGKKNQAQKQEIKLT